MRFLNLLSIKTKFIVMILVVSLCAMWASTLICSSSGKALLTERVYSQLTSLRAARTYQIQDYFNRLIQHTQTLSDDYMFIAAMKEFKAAFAELTKADVPAEYNTKIDAYYTKEILPRLAKTTEGKPLLEAYTPNKTAARYLQYHYIAANSNPLGKKFLLDDAGDKSKYSSVHARYHPRFRNIAERFGYYDMYLLDTTGDIVYMLSKEIDFGTNLIDGRYSQSNLGRALLDCLKAKSTEYVKIVDFEPWQPSYDAPASFVASPIFEGTEMIGILAFQLPIDAVNRIMTNDNNWEKIGLGKTGESFLVGKDFLMRSASRFLIEDPEGYAKTVRSNGVDEKTINKIKEYNTSILLQEVRTKSVEAGLAGKEGTWIINDYRGIPVLNSYAPLEIDGLKWVVIAKIDVSEAYAPINRFQKNVLISATLIMVIVTLLGMWLANIFTRPIKTLMTGARRVGAGEFDTVVTSKSKDEFGELAKSFNEAVSSLRNHANTIEQKNRENEKLLLRILPAPIAKRLKGGEKNIAEQVSNVTVLFSDLHHFTQLYRSMSAQEVVAVLNEMVTAFDEMAEKYGIDKIKTIGDGYMAACGLSVPRLDHEKRMVEFAEEMLAFVRRYSYEKGLHLDLKIGIDSGDVVAGIMGKNKMLYDVWGDTVNIANQLRSACPPEAILVSQNVCDRLHDLYEFELVGEIQEPGKQKLVAWQLKSTQQPVTATATKEWASGE